MSFDAGHPFNALPLLPPKAKLETTPALKACIAARAALAELKALGSLIPNQSILINSIPLLLDVTTRGAWGPWIAFMIDAVADTATWTSGKVRAIRALLDETAARIRAEAPKVYSRELAELIFAQPYCRIANVVDAGIAQRQSASVYLKALAAIGVLEERQAGRERLFINPALVQLLVRDLD